MFFGNAIKYKVAANTYKNPVIAKPYPPRTRKSKAMMFIILLAVNIVFTIFVFIKLSEKNESFD
ncbi:hypothetical protein AX766_08830 [Flavobacterium covae]|nr:hypothetical protein AX766_08830 [Flavobacterium covae]